MTISSFDPLVKNGWLGGFLYFSRADALTYADRQSQPGAILRPMTPELVQPFLGGSCVYLHI
jgi:hypothetical protein